MKGLAEWQNCQELVKEIEHYGNRIHTNNIDEFITLFVYSYEDKAYVIVKSHGHVISLLSGDNLNIIL